jgi:hypothetical protein
MWDAVFSASRREVHALDACRTLMAAEVLRDQYAAELPADYDLILEFSAEPVCTAKRPRLRERECVAVAPDSADQTSLFRRMAATAKLHDRVRRAGKVSESGGRP